MYLASATLSEISFITKLRGKWCLGYNVDTFIRQIGKYVCAYMNINTKTTCVFKVTEKYIVYSLNFISHTQKY